MHDSTDLYRDRSGKRDPRLIHYIKANRLGVLCSIARRSSILVYRGGSPNRVATLRRMRDSTFLQIVGRDAQGLEVIGYSRSINALTARRMTEQLRSRGLPKPPSRDHDGIEDVFVEKGSEILYWSMTRWLTLAGMD